MMKHCCDQMDFFLQEDKVSINYSDKFREYSISLKHTNGVQLILYCPWCSHKLPRSLRDEWFDILEKDHDKLLTDGYDLIPEDFKTDKWWLDRRL